MHARKTSSSQQAAVQETCSHSLSLSKTRRKQAPETALPKQAAAHALIEGNSVICAGQPAVPMPGDGRERGRDREGKRATGSEVRQAHRGRDERETDGAVGGGWLTQVGHHPAIIESGPRNHLRAMHGHACVNAQLHIRTPHGQLLRRSGGNRGRCLTLSCFRNSKTS
jgi:hypothetical protein